MRRTLELLEATRGFGYAIDYAKEIEQNEKEIARFEQMLQRGDFAPSTRELLSVLDLLIMDQDVRRKLGFTADEVATVAAYYDQYTDEVLERYGLHVPPDWSLSAARSIDKRIEALGFDDYLPTEAQVKKWLAVERQRLARHRRNQKQYGR